MRIVGQGHVVSKAAGPFFVPKEEFRYEGSVYVPNMPYSMKGISYELVLRWASEGKVDLKEL